MVTWQEKRICAAVTCPQHWNVTCCSYKLPGELVTENALLVTSRCPRPAIPLFICKLCLSLSLSFIPPLTFHPYLSLCLSFYFYSGKTYPSTDAARLDKFSDKAGVKTVFLHGWYASYNSIYFASCWTNRVYIVPVAQRQTNLRIIRKRKVERTIHLVRDILLTGGTHALKLRPQ